MPASDSVYHSNQQFAYSLPDHNSKTSDYPAESTIYSEGDFYSVEFPNAGNTWRVRTQEVTYNAKHRIGNHTRSSVLWDHQSVGRKSRSPSIHKVLRFHSICCN